MACIMTDAEIIAQRRSSEAHIGIAEDYVNTLAAGFRGNSTGVLTEIDIRLYELYLHAAEVHLKLAEAKHRLVPAFLPDYG
jgi:hypothetical protein